MGFLPKVISLDSQDMAALSSLLAPWDCGAVKLLVGPSNVPWSEFEHLPPSFCWSKTFILYQGTTNKPFTVCNKNVWIPLCRHIYIIYIIYIIINIYIYTSPRGSCGHSFLPPPSWRSAINVEKKWPSPMGFPDHKFDCWNSWLKTDLKVQPLGGSSQLLSAG